MFFKQQQQHAILFEAAYSVNHRVVAVTMTVQLLLKKSSAAAI